jgi:hypothetical protein
MSYKIGGCWVRLGLDSRHCDFLAFRSDGTLRQSRHFIAAGVYSGVSDPQPLRCPSIFFSCVLLFPKPVGISHFHDLF